MERQIGNIVIIGATSTLAIATARLYARLGCCFFLVARDEKKLKEMSKELSGMGSNGCFFQSTDLLDETKHELLLKEAWGKLGQVDLLLICHGSLPDQKKCENDFSAASYEFEVNFLSVVSVLTHAAKYFERVKCGTIAVIGSVAGDRGRQSNYVYGSAKGAVDIFLQGLRNRLYGKGVHVLTIKPGLVKTKMTENMRKNFLYSDPELIARGIVRAVGQGRNIVYLPFWWRGVMFVIKLLPEAIFKRMRL